MKDTDVIGIIFIAVIVLGFFGVPVFAEIFNGYIISLVICLFLCGILGFPQGFKGQSMDKYFNKELKGKKDNGKVQQWKV